MSVFLLLHNNYAPETRNLSGRALSSLLVVYMAFFFVVAAMDYFVSAFLKLTELDADYFDNVSPSTPEQLQLQLQQQDRIICPALASPDSPTTKEDADRGEKSDGM